jgi:hypothetical protein
MKFSNEYFKQYSYTWQALVKCRAGGQYNESGDEGQHFDRTIDEIVFFLDKKSGN